MLLLGVIAGMALALMGLLPGVHAGSLVLLLLPLLHGDAALVAAGVAVGMGGVLVVLHTAYHPMAESMLAHADVAAQMTYEGNGRGVVWVHNLAVSQAYIGVLFFGGVAAVMSLCGFPVLVMVVGLLKYLGWPALLWVCWQIIRRAKRRVATGVLMVLAGAIGFITFHLPALTGNEWGMSALLGGLFTLPAGWALLGHGQSKALPVQAALGDTLTIDPDGSEFTGTILGILTGFLAGVGTGSLVAAWRPDDPWKYLGMSAAAEMANNIWALLALVLAGVGRSGMAVAAAEAGAGMDAWSGLIVLLAVGLGLWAGLKLIGPLESRYQTFAEKLPQRKLGGWLVASTVGLVAWHAGWTGLGVMICAWFVSSLAKSWKTPNQALMAALIAPVLLERAGATASLLGVLGL